MNKKLINHESNFALQSAESIENQRFSGLPKMQSIFDSEPLVISSVQCIGEAERL